MDEMQKLFKMGRPILKNGRFGLEIGRQGGHLGRHPVISLWLIFY
jgi:hypothetical protein